MMTQKITDDIRIEIHRYALDAAARPARMAGSLRPEAIL